ncbi:Uncharacterized ACR, YdiU/UPF0061 family [Serratia fonticola]|uniref:protein adenylyltransferase SelO family protein n=1 Tax=Serratia fonticola TaxID=47917 RepID=UPI002182AE29|nr:protein adenylyltransferase SelO family protein [Serratia fonticola]CAI2161189.1 Uncharacterized ACR, YdiU/UPF0061 family [Serratia fonticola]
MDAELNFREGEVSTGNMLPEQSYIPFKTIKLASPELVWLNQELNEMSGMNEEELLDTFAYVTPDYMPTSGLNEQDCQFFLADRYGSRYEACNGGSARCGIRNTWQVKGIGRNPLVAINIDKGHTNGKLCLTKAISEAVWGEICHRELPYGAIRTLAIIKTGAWMDADYGLPEIHTQPCALVIREVAIRPAHFERATFFWPSNAYMQLRNDDALRVQRAIERITHFLPGGEEGLVAGLTSFVERMACQIAVSRVKGIPHGSLTSSNISIDGRFLDFGTLSSVPDFANYVLAAGQGGVWDDHLLIAEWLRHIGVFINKYHQEKLNQQQLDTVITHFFDRLDLEENIAVALHVGMRGCRTSLVEQGGKIKQALRENSRQPKAFHGFDNNDFISRLARVLSPLGVTASSSMFPLRHERFSLYTLTRAIADTVVKQGGGRESVSALIDGYIDWKISHA